MRHPCQYVSTDLFTTEGNEYLLVADQYNQPIHTAPSFYICYNNQADENDIWEMTMSLNTQIRNLPVLQTSSISRIEHHLPFIPSHREDGWWRPGAAFEGTVTCWCHTERRHFQATLSPQMNVTQWKIHLDTACLSAWRLDNRTWCNNKNRVKTKNWPEQQDSQQYPPLHASQYKFMSRTRK